MYGFFEYPLMINQNIRNLNEYQMWRFKYNSESFVPESIAESIANFTQTDEPKNL